MNEETQTGAFVGALMRQLEGATHPNFDVHDIELALGNGTGLTLSVVELPQASEESLASAVHLCLDARLTVPQGVVMLLEISSRLPGQGLYRVASGVARLRCPNSHIIPVLRRSLQGGAAQGRLTVWCR